MEDNTHTVQIQDYRGRVVHETERMSYMAARALARNYNDGEELHGDEEAYVIAWDHTRDEEG